MALVTSSSALAAHWEARIEFFATMPPVAAVRECRVSAGHRECARIHFGEGVRFLSVFKTASREHELYTSSSFP